MSQHITSYEDFLRQMQVSPDACLQEKGNEIIRHFQNEHHFPSGLSPIIYWMDYTTNTCIYADDACFDMFGYTARELTEDGANRYIKHIHPCDYQVLNSKVFPYNIQFLEEVSPEQFSNLIFSFNYRVLHAQGNFLSVLQRCTYMVGAATGKPVGSIGTIFDISHFKNDKSIVHTIEEIKKHKGGVVQELLYKNILAPDESDSLSITQRELEVLKWMAEGFNSKQIARSLNLSINTVYNHRKNMLRKTGCNSSTELLNYTMRLGYL